MKTERKKKGIKSGRSGKRKKSGRGGGGERKVEKRGGGERETGEKSSYLIIEDIIKLSSKYLCLYPSFCTTLNLSQRSFSLQWITVNVETPDFSKC